MSYSHFYWPTDDYNDTTTFTHQEFTSMSLGIARVLLSQPRNFLLRELDSDSGFTKEFKRLEEEDLLCEANIAAYFLNHNQISVHFRNAEPLIVNKENNMNGFCNTNRCNGDTVIAAAIMAMCDDTNGKLKFSSDGDDMSLLPARALYEAVFDRPFDKPLDIAMEDVAEIGFYDNNGTWFTLIDNRGFNRPYDFDTSLAEPGPNKTMHIARLNNLYSGIACPKSLEKQYRDYVIDDNPRFQGMRP